MKKSRSVESTGICVLFTVALIGIALWHIWFVWSDLHLAQSHMFNALGIGAVAFLLFTSLGFFLEHQLLGVVVGTIVGYLIVIGYIVLWMGIPDVWLFDRLF